MVSEMTVIVKDDERTLKNKYLIYDDYTVSEHDPIIKEHIDRVLQEFAGEPTDIQVKISLELL